MYWMEEQSQTSIADTYHLTPQDHVWGNSPLHSACYHGKLDTVQLLILERPSLDINMKNHRCDSSLTLACQAGRLDVIRFLLTINSCDVNHINKAGDTPLHVACFEGHTESVNLLCSSGKCTVDCRNRNGDTPLVLACREGHMDIVEFLIKSMQSSTNTQNKDGNTPLHVACLRGNSQVIKFLVSVSNSDILNTRNVEGDTPLHLACQNGHQGVVTFLFNKVNLNHQNNDENTPLNIAILFQRKNIAKLLYCHHKCDINITNKDWNTPFHLVCMEGWTDRVQHLLSTRENDINAQNMKGNTPLHISCLESHTDMVKIIITQKSCDFNCKNEHGNTPLHLACLEGKLDIVRLLVEMKECDLNLKNKAGVCALHLAFYNRHQSVVEVLIRHDRCDVNCTDAVDNMPLGLAVILSWTNIVKFFITEKLCNVSHQNKFGDTPLHLSKRVSVAELLKCDVNSKNERGDTALSIACQHNLDLVKFFIKRKHCEVLIKNKYGDSPLHLACRHGKLDIVKYLVNEQNLNCEDENNDGDSPLCVAAKGVHNNVVQFLVARKDCNMNHQNRKGDTPLHIACRRGDICLVKTLTDYRECNVSCDLNIRNNRQETPALIAFRKHHNDIFRLLVTKYHHECLLNVFKSVERYRWPDVVRILTIGGTVQVLNFLGRVWNVDALDETSLPICHVDGYTLTQLAQQLCYDIIRLVVKDSQYNLLFSILRGERNPDPWPEVLALLSAGRNKSIPFTFQSEVEIIIFLAHIKGLKVDHPMKHGNTLLHFLCQYSKSPELLINIHEVVHDVNSCNSGGYTPLHIACLAGNINGVRFLTSIKDCKLNVINNQQETPALIAFRNQHNGIFRLLVTEHRYECLLSLLESINRDLWPEVVRILAVDGIVTVPSHFQSQFDVIEFLFKARVWDLNCLDDHYNTPLHIACLAGDLDVVKIITSLTDCHFNMYNKDGNTPAQLALQRHHDNVFRLLVTDLQIRDSLLSVLKRVSKDEWPNVILSLIANRNVNIPTFQSEFQVISFLVEENFWNMIKNGNTILHHLCQYSANPELLFDKREATYGVNFRNTEGNTPLHLACSAGNVNGVTFLTSIKGCNFNIKNDQQETSALIAFSKHYNEIFRLLVTEHHYECLLSVLESINRDLWPEVVRILAVDETVAMPSHFQSQFDVIEFLFKVRVWDLNCLDDHGNTPLHITCLAGDLDVVKIITSLTDCYINAPNQDGNTPAQLAFKERHGDVFRFLTIICYKYLLEVLKSVSHQIWPDVMKVFRSQLSTFCRTSQFRPSAEKTWNPNQRDKYGNTLLHYACLSNNIQLVKFLVDEADFDVNSYNSRGDTALHIACYMGSLNLVKVFFRSNVASCDFYARNDHGETSALIALHQLHDDIFRLLIEQQCVCLLSVLEDAGVDSWSELVRILSKNRIKIPFHIKSPSELLTFLIQSEIWDPNCPDQHGNTALHVACSYHQTSLKVIQSLIETCDVNCKNKNGDTPLHIACRICNSSIMTYLISLTECDINCQNSSRGDTPLHLACRVGATDIVTALLNHGKCIVDVENYEGNTPLILACQRLSNLFNVVQLVNTKMCNVNHQNKEGYSPLHYACQSGNIAAVRVLKSGCDIHLRNKKGETAALVAFNHYKPIILKLLITDHCECLIDLLDMINKEKWPNVVNIVARDITLPKFSIPLDVVKFLVKHDVLDLTHLDESGNSALHRACYRDCAGLVRFLVDDQQFDVMLSNDSGDTPLHTACLQGHMGVVEILLSTFRMKAGVSCKADVPNKEGDTPLHCACSRGHFQVVRILLFSGLFDFMACNNAGFIPVELAKSCQKIKEFVLQYVKYTTSDPLQFNKVCVVGNHSTGKSTLVNVLQRGAKRWMKVFPRKFKKVANVESCTCGIIPVQLHSKKFGNIIFYDFAGHIEYYSSHAAILENFRSSSPPPLFIILIKLVESQEEIKKQLYYWTSMVENHCKTSNFLPRVIVVGSFSDKIKDSLPSKIKLIRQLLGLAINESSLNITVFSSLQIVGFVPLDCRIKASQGINTLCDLLTKNFQTSQEAVDINFGCHVLHTLLSDQFKDKVACTVSEIMACIRSDYAHEDLLPHDTDSLVHLLKALSDYGEILLLLNQEQPQNGWAIIDKRVVLSEITGTVFAPEEFEHRYKGFAMSTGVVPHSNIRKVFPNYNLEMITSFLTHLEFCQEVKDPDALGGITETHLQLIQSDIPSDVTERYFFFPALVNLEKPTDVWEDNEEMNYNCGWLLRCIKPDKFLTSRFIHVLLLRLAFSYALTPHHYPEDPSYPVLRKRCSVWKNGIQWFSRAGGIETIVEVQEQTKRVAILMRCPTKAEIECAKLRSSVIEKVLSIQNEFCPAVTPMAECLIHPNDVQYPLPSTEQLKLFSHKEIAELAIANPEENEQFAIGEIPSSVTDAQQLLSFEPYLGLGEALVRQLFSDKDADKTVSETFLDKLAERVFQRMPMFKKMLNTSENDFAECHGQAEVRQCCYLFKLWSQQREKVTYRSLRKEFDRYSIFHGQNPLVSFHYSLILLLVHKFVDKQ